MDWYALTFRDKLAIGLVVIAATIIALFVYVVDPDAGKSTNSGFGPDWDCVHIPKGGGPICVKNPQQKPQDAH